MNKGISFTRFIIWFILELRIRSNRIEVWDREVINYLGKIIFRDAPLIWICSQILVILKLMHVFNDWFMTLFWVYYPLFFLETTMISNLPSLCLTLTIGWAYSNRNMCLVLMLTPRLKPWLMQNIVMLLWLIELWSWMSNPLVGWVRAMIFLISRL